MGKMTSMWADVPNELREPHVVMERYAEWALPPRGPSGRCGSAEGRYIPTGGQALEDRRKPVDQMGDKEAKVVQRALLMMDELHRGHLVLLYVRQRQAVSVLKAGHVPARLSQMRQLEGLRRFWSALQLLQREALDTQPLAPFTLAAHC
jgi:hypothetical protein